MEQLTKREHLRTVYEKLHVQSHGSGGEILGATAVKGGFAGGCCLEQMFNGACWL